MQFSPSDVLFLKKAGIETTSKTLSEQFAPFEQACRERNMYRDLYQEACRLNEEAMKAVGRGSCLASMAHRRFCFAACAAAGFALLSLILWITR